MSTDIDRKVWTECVYASNPYNLTDEEICTLARRTIGELLIASEARFQMHAGDIIFDYEWLKKYARPHLDPETEVTPFYWSWDECGTLIGYDRPVVAHRKNLWKVSIPAPIKGRIDIIISKEEDHD